LPNFEDVEIRTDPTAKPYVPIPEVAVTENEVEIALENLKKNFDGAFIFKTDEAISATGFTNFCIEFAKKCNDFATPKKYKTYEETFNDENLKNLTKKFMVLYKNFIRESDMKQFGVPEKWSISKRGDCEDFMLALIESIIEDQSERKVNPESPLNLEMVYVHKLLRDENGKIKFDAENLPIYEGHIALAVQKEYKGESETVIFDVNTPEPITLSQFLTLRDNKNGGYIEHILLGVYVPTLVDNHYEIKSYLANYISGTE
jgi:predicted transglutaminase-like cysteine proteinase